MQSRRVQIWPAGEGRKQITSEGLRAGAGGHSLVVI